MKKRKFGMHHLNISQGRYLGISHKQLNAYDLCGEDKGIDFFRAYYPYEVIGIHKYNYVTGKGFSNTIHFYDTENDVTLAMTHIDTITNDWYLGKVYNIGDVMYQEGKCGKATGNHIHLEIAKGKQTVKYCDAHGNYVLKNWINIEEYFYIDDSITVVNDGGYQFSHEEEDIIPEIDKAGYQEYKYNGIMFYTYTQQPNEDIRLLSLRHPKLGKLSQIQTSEYEVVAKKNASFFVMSTGYVNGSEVSDIYDEAVPQSQGFIDVVKLKDGTWKFGNFGFMKYRKDDVILRYSTGACLIAGGYYSEEYSVACTPSILTDNKIQSCLGIDWSNRAIFITTSEKTTPYVLRQFGLSHFGGLQFMFRDDSGGSAQLNVGDEIKNGVTNERALPNCLVIVKTQEVVNTKDDTEVEQPVEATKKESNGLSSEELRKEVLEINKKGRERK